MNPSGDIPKRPWRQLLASWRLWLLLVACLLVAAVAWLFGYD